MAHIDSIASQLPAMNTDDLSKIRKITDMLLGNGTEEKPKDRNESILFEAVKAELSTMGFKSNIGYSNLRQSKYYKSWQRGLEVFTEFVDNVFDPYIKSDTQRLGLYRILIQTVMADLRRKNLPISLGMIATNIERVQQTFDRSFPRYLQSGIAHLVPKALLKNQK